MMGQLYTIRYDTIWDIYVHSKMTSSQLNLAQKTVKQKVMGKN